MSNSFIQWILGVGFGIVVGWSIGSIYYEAKLRKMRWENFEKELENKKKDLNTLSRIGQRGKVK